jgi:hypothetical protein
MLLVANAALSQTLVLAATLLGIGVVVNVLVVYIIGQVFAERRQNQERREAAP